jgi:DNA-binding SARP family transcriptional activator
MQWRALGSVEVVVADQLVDLGPPRQRALFGLLLSRIDRPVPLDTVIEEVWAGTPPAAAVTSIRAYVSNLRRVLEPHRPPRAPATILRTKAPGYLLDSRCVDFDVRRFTCHAQAGRQALHSADPQRALGEFDAALKLWRGPPYADMADAGWAAPEIARLQELRLSVVEGRCSAQLALGDHHGAVAELEMHVRSHPLREHGCELLALALYRAGRQAEALGVLRATRTRLATELGLDPGVALQRLERDILTHAPSLDWHPPRSSGTVRAAGQRSLTPVVEPAPAVVAPLMSAPALGLPAHRPGASGVQRVVSTQVQGLSEVVGREAELAALRAAFTASPRRGRPVWRVLTGLGGVGKTSLARAYAQRFQEHYALVWWIRAGDPQAVAGEFRTLLALLAPHYAETHDPTQAAHAVLANWTEPWLLIIDNVATPQALHGLLPACGAGDVLVTSRFGIWPDRQVVVPVQPLDLSHAVTLITTLSGDPDQATAAALAAELGGLPLALAQAACYVAHSALDLAGYLKLYRSRRAELHQHGHAPDYPDTLATTWRLAFDQLSAPARAVLNLLAWYAPDTIPLDRLLTADAASLQLPDSIGPLLRPVLCDSLHQHRAITELIGYGLLTRTGPAGSVTVHRLVQAVTADQLVADNTHHDWINTAAAVLQRACPRWPATRAAISAWQSLHTHVRTLINHAEPAHLLTLTLRYTFADWTGISGDFLRARQLYAGVVEDAQRALGPDHRHTLAIRSSHAYWTGKAGDVARARELSAAVVRDMIRVLGPHDRETLLARTDLARWTGAAGEVQRARELVAAVVQDAEQRLDAGDRYALVPRAELARWTGAAGEVQQARELAAAVVEDTQRLLGADHRYTLLARASLVRWTGEAGDVEGARELAAALVEDDERLLGADHRHTLLARAALARWTAAAGDVSRACTLANAVLADFVRVYGPNHHDTRIARTWLAPWTRLAPPRSGRISER